MRLLDRVSQARDSIARDTVQLPGVETLADRVRACSLRYVLGDDVAELCAAIAFHQDGIVAGSVDTLRLPAPDLWMEYRPAGLRRIYTHCGLVSEMSAASARRVGLLVQGRPGERAGEISVCWENQAGAGPERSPLAIEFDFDDPGFAASSDGVHGFGLLPANLPDLQRLFDRMRFRVDPAWRDYNRRRCGGIGPRYLRALRAAATPLYADAAFLAAFLLLSGAGRALRSRAIDHSRPDCARPCAGKRGKRPLLDYVEISLAVALAHARKRDALEGVRVRAHPRPHHVRGHVVRRGRAAFWRGAHLRGAGP